MAMGMSQLCTQKLSLVGVFGGKFVVYDPLGEKSCDTFRALKEESKEL